MTSRNATSVRAREIEVAVTRAPSDWARLLAFGAVQWPWLSKSLYGGPKTDRAALLALLALSDQALPHRGSWKADAGLLHRIVDAINTHQPETIVELGAGASTLVTARALRMIGGTRRLVSFDQRKDFVTAVRCWLADHDLNADVRYAPSWRKTASGQAFGMIFMACPIALICC
ncbi:MAG: hypothetical protein ACKOAM_07385 [Chakrabartia sp.]